MSQNKMNRLYVGKMGCLTDKIFDMFLTWFILNIRQSPHKAGGDGTVHELLDQEAKKKVVIIIKPTKYLADHSRRVYSRTWLKCSWAQ